MKNNDNGWYFSMLIKSAFIAACFVAMLLSFTGCKLLSKVSRSSQDTASVRKDINQGQRVDTSKSKSELQYTKETFIFPPKDTSVINIYNPLQPSTQPTVYIREVGNKKEETQTFNYESFKRELLDSIASSKSEKQTETKIKAGPSLIEWILIAAIAFLIFSKFITIKKP